MKLTKNELEYLAGMVAGTVPPNFWTFAARDALLKKLQKELQK